MSADAETIIRDWIDSKCDPSPYSFEERIRRVMSDIATAVNTITETYWKAALQIDFPDTDDGEWELTNG